MTVLPGSPSVRADAYLMMSGDRERRVPVFIGATIQAPHRVGGAHPTKPNTMQNCCNRTKSSGSGMATPAAVIQTC